MEQVSAEGPGLTHANTAQVATFTLVSHTTESVCVNVFMIGPSGANIREYQTAGEPYEVTFIPTAAGPHIINIKVSGGHIQGSPFLCRVTDPETTEDQQEPDIEDQQEPETTKPAQQESEPVCFTSKSETSIPTESIENVLLKNPDMPVRLFTPLAKRMLAANPLVNIKLLGDNMYETPDGKARFQVLLDCGIKLFDATGFRPGVKYLFQYSTVHFRKHFRATLVTYLLGLTGEALENARVAFKGSPDIIPKTKPDTQIRLFLHLRAIPKHITDYHVLLVCAQNNVFQEKTACVMRALIKERGDTDAERIREISDRDATIRINILRCSVLTDQNKSLTNELAFAQKKISAMKTEYEEREGWYLDAMNDHADAQEVQSNKLCAARARISKLEHRIDMMTVTHRSQLESILKELQ